jgi:hypothetical protein
LTNEKTSGEVEVATLSPRPEVFMAHRNARLTLHGRRLLIQRVVTDGRPVAMWSKSWAAPALPATHGWPAGAPKATPD